MEAPHQFDARPRAVRDPGLAHRRGAHARLHERGGARAHARDRRAAPVEPLARRAVAQGRDVRQHAGGQGAALRLRRRRGARARRARRARPATPASAPASTTATSTRGPARGAAGPRADARTARAERPEGSYTAELLADPPRIGEKVQEEAEEVVARRPRGVRRARGRGGRRRPLPPRGAARAAAGSASPTPRRCSLPAVADQHLEVTPSVEEAAELAGAYNLIPVRHTFIEDCETPVSAFLKLRGDGPAFLLESAEQGQRVGRWSFIGWRPRRVLRWSLRGRGRPVRDGRPGRSPSTARRRSPACRRSPAAPSASSASTACAPSSACPSPTRTCSGCRTWR